MSSNIDPDATLKSSQHKEGIADLFDTVADGYDHPALSWFPFSADAVVDWLKPRPGSRFLDVATGTAVIAVAAAQYIQPGGRVIAVDISENMLDVAAAKARHLGLDNIDFFKMDAESLVFKKNYFDYVACSFGLFFLPDMLKALKEWNRITKSGGQVVFTSFKQSAFQPVMKLLVDQLEEFGVELGEQTFSSQRLIDEEVCRNLLTDAGYDDVVIKNKQCGYHLLNVEDWWAILWNTGARGFLSRLPVEKVPSFKSHHLKSVQEMFTDDGLWLDVEINMARGTAN